MHDTLPLLQLTDFPSIRRGALETLQVNIGYRCNQRCLHCHVNAGPTRTEMMDAENLQLVLDVLSVRGIQTLDITGGAPELHSGFRDLVAAARQRGVRVLDRCNLTVLFEPGQHDLADFLAEQGVEIVASLPCYSHDNVDAQRGEGVFDKSIRALQYLNELGYGQAGSGLVLNLVYNPQGPFLPPEQTRLKADYQQHLADEFGIVFSELFAIANMPIKRFGATLVTRGEFYEYMRLLRSNHSDANLQQVMCRSLISVDWQGFIYDCDFNQQLGVTMPNAGCDPLAKDAESQTGAERLHLRDLLQHDFAGHRIAVAGHCYGCTAGSGSSCGGALSDATGLSEQAS